MRTILIIGIGAGNPEYITMQAVNGLNRARVFFLMDKGDAKHKLNDLRRDILQRYVVEPGYRVVQAPSPERQSDENGYLAAVEQLNADKQQLFERLIEEQLAQEECGAFLVWGDPALYDSTVRIIQAIEAAGRVAVEYQVIPGITSVQALAAQHKVALNTLGGAVEITTGRRLGQGLQGSADSLVVMLDAENSFVQLEGANFDIYWGAYLGTADEILISGRLQDVAQQIVTVREAARQANGWIMDTYLLRRRAP